MNTILIPHKIIGKGDLVILPRKDYEDLFLRSTGKTDWLYEKKVAKYVISRINKAEKEFKNGQAIKWKNL